jgi:hypothetical protein
MNQPLVVVARAIGILGIIAGISIVAIAWMYFLKHPAQADATEVRALWFLVGAEVAIVMPALSWVLERIALHARPAPPKLDGGLARQTL